MMKSIIIEGLIGFTPERDTHRIFMNFMEYSTYCIFKLNMWNIPKIP